MGDALGALASSAPVVLLLEEFCTGLTHRALIFCVTFASASSLNAY